MAVPDGAEQFRYAELAFRLPLDWPLDAQALQSPEFGWPVMWLRRVARLPHENQTWLGRDAIVIPNGNPPAPLAPNTKLSCLLAMTEDSIFGYFLHSDGTEGRIYTLVPIYVEEWEFEQRHGAYKLVKRFQKERISRVLDINRQNVAVV